MKKNYDGLEIFKISFDPRLTKNEKSDCVAMIQMKMENGICISPEYQQQIYYVGDKG